MDASTLLLNLEKGKGTVLHRKKVLRHTEQDKMVGYKLKEINFQNQNQLIDGFIYFFVIDNHLYVFNASHGINRPWYQKCHGITYYSIVSITTCPLFTPLGLQRLGVANLWKFFTLLVWTPRLSPGKFHNNYLSNMKSKDIFLKYNETYRVSIGNFQVFNQE